MTMTGIQPLEQFPQIGTIENCAMCYDGGNVLLCYDIAPVSSGGIAILEFKRVISFCLDPMNVEGLGKAVHPVSPWSFTEVLGSEKVARWKSLKPRFWTISFNDETVEILFQSVELRQETRAKLAPSAALVAYLARSAI